jgi:hypothetical protein
MDMLSMVWQQRRNWKAEKMMSTFYISGDGAEAKLFLDIFKPINVLMQLDKKVLGANEIVFNFEDELVQFCSDE